MELLTASIILVACVSIGCCSVFITSNRTGINKHSRSYIKDMQQDLKYLAEAKKQEALEYTDGYLSKAEDFLKCNWFATAAKYASR